MARTSSPLRYPGGKACLYRVISTILKANRLERRHYVEPFVGGGGLALALLYGGHVSDIHINDIDPAIWSFWHSVLDHTDELIAKVTDTPITVDEWLHQRATYRSGDVSDPVRLGFATFFLNRTNRSGVISSGGVIGGLSQDGPYKIDCRFNRDDLVRRIRRIKVYHNRIHLSKADAQEFIFDSQKHLPTSTFFFIDPPYFGKGASLYTNFYGLKDHEALSRDILSIGNPWVTTYDNTPQIAALYRSRRQFEFDIGYSVQNKRRTTELMIVSKRLRIPETMRTRQVSYSSRRLGVG